MARGWRAKENRQVARGSASDAKRPGDGRELVFWQEESREMARIGIEGEKKKRGTGHWNEACAGGTLTGLSAAVLVVHSSLSAVSRNWHSPRALKEGPHQEQRGPVESRIQRVAMGRQREYGLGPEEGWRKRWQIENGGMRKRLEGQEGFDK